MMGHMSIKIYEFCNSLDPSCQCRMAKYRVLRFFVFFMQYCFNRCSYEEICQVKKSLQAGRSQSFGKQPVSSSILICICQILKNTIYLVFMNSIEERCRTMMLS